jgi:tRNA 2-selenouridine synthase
LKQETIVTVAQIDDFDEIVDVRSPGEFAQDHLPRAVNCPVLDDEERARVGTIYVQDSPFKAKKIGAALVSKNIARHIEEQFCSRERDWRPLVYCWRGGERSAALAYVMRQIGWRAATLRGGYHAYRREVRAQLEDLPRRHGFQVVCGATGSGKSRLLEALAAQGAQVLNLERLACHRGSVLGDLPGEPQPSQKMFESELWDVLRRFDPAHPVFVEAESRRIGIVQLPTALLDRMRAGDCVLIEVPLEERLRLLMEEYRHFLDDPAQFKLKLESLKDLYGREVVGCWLAQADARNWESLVPDLLRTHYDPAYQRSTLKNFTRLGSARMLSPKTLTMQAMTRIAAQLTRELQA